MSLQYYIAMAAEKEAAVNVCDSPFNLLRIGCAGQNSAGSNLSSFLIAAIRWILSISAGVAVFMIIYAGVLLVASSALPDKAAEAKKIILWSIIGLVIIVFSFVITSFIRDLFYGIGT